MGKDEEKKKKKKKKNKQTWGDLILTILSVLGGLLCLATIIPALPWRKMDLNQQFHMRFPSDRYMSMFTVTNQNRQYLTWMAMAQKVCNKFTQMTKSGPLLGVLSTVGQGVAEGLGLGEYTSGAMATCGGWRICMNHAQQRCYGY